MKVGELIKKLNQFDDGLDVICSTEDNELLPKNHLLRLLEITDVVAVEAEKRRGADHVASFKLGKTSASEKHVIIEITSDF